MTDDERADLLARAIEDFINGANEAAPLGLDDAEIRALLEVAEQRLALGRERQAEGRSQERELWERLQRRLHLSHRTVTPDIDIPRDQHEALRDIIALRMQMAREVLDVAESHKDEVWARLQARMGPDWPSSNRPAQASETPIKPRNDAEVEAITRRSLNRLAELAADPVNVRIRERMRRDIAAVTHQPHVQGRRWGRWRNLAGFAAVLAVGAGLALPLPVTGLDQHPIVRLADSVASQVGLTSAEATATTDS